MLGIQKKKKKKLDTPNRVRVCPSRVRTGHVSKRIQKAQ